MEKELLNLNPFRLFLTTLLEPAFRIGGFFAKILGWDQEGIEMNFRGRVLGGPAGWKVGRNVRFVGPCHRFRFGKKVCLFGNAYLNANGPEGFIEVGEQTHLDQYCVLYGQGGLTIGKYCAIASGVIIYTQTNEDSMKNGTPLVLQPTRYSPVFIRDGCWLGAGVKIIPGVILGEGAFIGAGAVVISNIPPKVIAVGIPAKILKER